MPWIFQSFAGPPPHRRYTPFLILVRPPLFFFFSQLRDLSRSVRGVEARAHRDATESSAPRGPRPPPPLEPPSDRLLTFLSFLSSLIFLLRGGGLGGSFRVTPLFFVNEPSDILLFFSGFLKPPTRPGCAQKSSGDDFGVNDGLLSERRGQGVETNQRGDR